MEVPFVIQSRRHAGKVSRIYGPGLLWFIKARFQLFINIFASMKIAFLANADSVHSHRWIRYFAEQTDHTLYWISPVHSIDRWFEGRKNVRYYELSGLFRGIVLLHFFWHLVSIISFLRKIQPDVFHVHYAGRNGLLGALAHTHPMVLTAWGSDVLFAGGHFIKRFLVSFALHNADLITCDAEHMRRAIRKFGIPTSRVHIIQFGIDTKHFAPGSCTPETKETLRIPDRYRAVISMRNFDPIYDIETVIKAIPAVLKQCPQTVFLIGGRGPQKEYLASLVSEMHVEDAVRFLGFIPNMDLPDYLRCTAVYVSTSLSDAGIASSTAEAMACGIPVVVTDSGENALWIRDGEDGFIIPVKNAEILAEKIILLLQNDTLRDRLSNRARSIIMERDDYWKEMQKMNELYAALSINRSL